MGARCGGRTLLVLLGTMAAIRSAKSLSVSAGAAASSTCTTTHLWLVRHGARHDYANPEWRETITALGHEVRDPPLSVLGWRQAQETAENVFAPLVAADEGPETLLVSPFLRVIQTGPRPRPRPRAARPWPPTMTLALTLALTSTLTRP